MNNHISQADREFRRRLDTFDYPPEDFNHREHLRLAYIYLCDASADEAFPAMREWTLQYLAHHKVDPSKYHETLTQAWMLAVRHFMAETPDSTSGTDFLEKNPIMLNSKIMMTHYSKELLFSDEARHAFVEPNLDPIPRYPDKTT